MRHLRPEVVRAGVPLHRHAHVLEHAQMWKHVRDLVGLGHAQSGHLVLGQPGDVPAVEPDAAARRPHLARDQAEKRRLARAIRAEDRAELTAADADVDAIDGEEAAERTRQLLCAEQGVVGHDEEGMSSPCGATRPNDATPRKAARSRHEPRPSATSVRSSSSSATELVGRQWAPTHFSARIGPTISQNFRLSAQRASGDSSISTAMTTRTAEIGRSKKMKTSPREKIRARRTDASS